MVASTSDSADGKKWVELKNIQKWNQGFGDGLDVGDKREFESGSQASVLGQVG